MKYLLLLLLPLVLLACKKEAHDIKVVITCDDTTGDSCYYNGGVQRSNSSETDRVLGPFKGLVEHSFEAYDGDIFFFTVYNPNTTPLAYQVSAYFDDGLIWECADSVYHKPSDGNKNTCNHSFVVGE